MSGYHYHKDCKWWSECSTEVVKNGKRELVGFRCPEGTGGKISLYYKGDLESIKYSCPCFEPHQVSFEDMEVQNEAGQ